MQAFRMSPKVAEFTIDYGSCLGSLTLVARSCDVVAALQQFAHALVCILKLIEEALACGLLKGKLDALCLKLHVFHTKSLASRNIGPLKFAALRHGQQQYSPPVGCRVIARILTSVTSA
jgi:hypothetical protein